MIIAIRTMNAGIKAIPPQFVVSQNCYDKRENHYNGNPHRTLSINAIAGCPRALVRKDGTYHEINAGVIDCRIVVDTVDAL